MYDIVNVWKISEVSDTLMLGDSLHRRFLPFHSTHIAAHIVAAAAFKASTVTRCSAAQANSTTAADAKAAATRATCNTENPISILDCTTEWDATKVAAEDSIALAQASCLHGYPAPIVIPPIEGGAVSAVMIFLHGLGGTGAE